MEAAGTGGPPRRPARPAVRGARSGRRTTGYRRMAVVGARIDRRLCPTF